MQRVEIFTDGACSGNPGAGGWGVILRCRDVEKELLESLNLEVLNDIAAMSNRNVMDLFKGKLSYNEDGTPVVTPNF